MLLSILYGLYYNGFLFLPFCVCASMLTRLPMELFSLLGFGLPHVCGWLLAAIQLVLTLLVDYGNVE